MDERDLRTAARDLERRVPPADFERIAVRGRRLRRRRRALQAAAAVGAVTATVVAGFSLAGLADPERRPQPVTPDDGPQRNVRTLLADPASVVDDAATLVSDTGAVLHRVTDPARGDCGERHRSAWVWTPWEGPSRAWAEGVGGRTAVAVPGGFAVSAPDAGCVDGRGEDDVGAYVVDADGRRTAIAWAAGAGPTCAPDPGGPRCVVDVGTATGRLRDGALRRQPSGSTFALPATHVPLWARSVDSRTLHWSTDEGASWSSHRTSLPRDGNVQTSAAGDWAVFFAYPEAEYTRDAGRTWHTWDGQRPLAPYVVANELVSVSADGDLVVVSHRPGQRPRVLASTDDSWDEFRSVDVRTAFGAVAPQPAGPWLWVPDRGRTWVSPDGLDWRAVDPRR